MTWLILALAAPLAWSVANYLDKFILTSSEKDGQGGSGGLLILSALVSLIFALCVPLIQGTMVPLMLDSQTIGVLILSGIFEALYIMFYFWALERGSTTTVISLFQFSPIMGLIFGYLMLSEVPTGTQVLAVLVILAGTLMIIKKKGERISFRGGVLLYMIVATAFVGIFSTLFKLAGESLPFWTAIFWQYLGIGILGFILFVSVEPYRKQTIDMLFNRSGKSLGLTLAAELMNIGALLAANAAVLLAPVALVLSISSVQPIFVLIEGAILFHLYPHLFGPDEKPSFRPIYLLGIVLVVIGGVLINW